ncbi:MAG: signal recognition particle protein [Acetobacteraceae bacterium]|nr:MAG: signal recognition particle protein [Acetobacteraceae bacterium]
MFEALSSKLNGVFDKLRRRGALTDADVQEALREVRVALLEADVALPVVKDITTKVRERAVGQEVLRSVSPAQQVIKIVNDCLVEALGGGEGDTGARGLDLNAPSPVPILMVGLQGSGKTTTSGKIALRLKTRDKKKVLLASLDVHRPAAQLQLETLAKQVGVASLPIIAGQTPLQIAERAMDLGRRELFDVVILDTAGRLAIDVVLMAEVAAVKTATRPHETLLVVDAMTGQDAVNTARAFQDTVGVTGIVMTRIDGDARGGAALSMRAVTGAPIKLLGAGEKLDALEDYANQLKQIGKMGSLSGILGMLPGVGKIKQQLEGANLDTTILKRQAAIIGSMTVKERRTPDLIKASRKKRIAAGSGASVQEVNKLLKQFDDMSAMMKRMSKLGQKGMMRGGLAALMPQGKQGPGGRRPY